MIAMKSSAKYLVWAALLAFCVGCNPLLPDPRFAGEPRIVSIEFPGIPAANVSIDQKNKVIRVKLPPVLPPVKTPETEVAGHAFAGFPNWANVFIEDDPKYRKIDLLGLGTHTGTQPAPVVATYRLEFVPAGPLEIDTKAWARNPPRESGVIDLSVPVKNLYANDLPVEARFTNVDTQETSVIDSLSPRLVGDNPYFRFLSRSWGSSADQMNWLRIDVPTFGAKVRPGTYRVSLVLKDGKTLNLPQPVTFVAGMMAVNDGERNGVPRLLPGAEYVISGRNLYAGDVTVRVLDSTDREVSLKNLEFDPYGNNITLTLPTQASEGRYVVQIINQFAAKVCQLIQVTNRPAAKLEISKLGWAFAYCSIKEPLPLTRNQETVLLLYEPASDLRLKITSVRRTSQEYFATLKPTPSANGSHRYTFVVPGIAPGGTYRVALQALDKGVVVQEGPAYWRLVEIR